MKRLYTIMGCNIYELPKIHNRSGNITVIEENLHLPFSIVRVYYLYDVPGGAERGAHAHKEMHHFMVAASGSFCVKLNDGRHKKTVELNRPYFGLHIPPGIWVELFNFSSGAVSLNFVSTKYDEGDYIREYEDFLVFRNEDTSTI
jgi:hypothetical protein